MSGSSGDPTAGFAFLVLLLALYLLPWMVASYRKHPNQNAILLLNIFLGLTLVGGLLPWSGPPRICQVHHLRNGSNVAHPGPSVHPVPTAPN